MNTYKKLKTFETYMSAGDGTNEKENPEYTDEVINEHIKTIIEGILETKQYFEMLKDSSEQVFGMIYDIIPQNAHKFSNTLYKKNDFLADLVDEIMETVAGSSTLDELDIIVDNMQKNSDLVEDNWDNVSKDNGGSDKLNNNNIENNTFEEEEDDDDDINEKDIEKDKAKDDSRDQHNLPLVESVRKIEDLEHFVKKYAKLKPEDKFKKGDIVYIGGIKTEQGEKFNGKKAEVIEKCEDKKDCYDLFISSLPSKTKGVANVKGMPEKFISKEKIEEVKETPKRTKPKSNRKTK